MRLLRLVLVVVILVAAVVGFYGFVPYGPSVETFVEIPSGMGTVGIARALERAGVIRSAAAFEAWREWELVAGTGSRTLKAGEYRFDHPLGLGEVYGKLQRGDVYTVTLVVPEGYDIFQIAHAVAEAGLGSEQAFLQAEKANVSLIALWSPGATSLEGYLFPATYKFGRHATAVQMLSAMVKRFGQEAEAIGLARGEMPRVVTLASLVEREVHTDGERALVAGVFENRLAAGMPLQTDPAVQYASELRGTWTGVIHESELRSDSAYNTYTHAGLPPGPICNPGLASLKAALHPAKSDYLYFVANAHGATQFSATLEEHAQQVAAYRAASR